MKGVYINNKIYSYYFLMQEIFEAYFYENIQDFVVKIYIIYKKYSENKKLGIFNFDY